MAGAYPGIWVEKEVVFVKLTFGTDISLNTDYSLFGVVESVLVQALNAVAQTATILGVSQYDVGTTSIDVMLGYASGWFSDTNGLILTQPTNIWPLTVTGQAINTTVNPPVAAANVTTTVTAYFAYFNGTMPVASSSNGQLETGPGASPGSYPTNSPVGTPGYYPLELWSV